MQTNPESAAVEAVAWIGPLGQLIKNDVFQARVNGLPDHGDLSTYTALYPQSALDALRGEVDCLRVQLAGSQERAMMVLRAKDDWMERANKAERRVADLEADSAYLKHLLDAIRPFKGKRGAFMALGAQDARTVRLWEVLEGRAP